MTLSSLNERSKSRFWLELEHAHRIFETRAWVGERLHGPADDAGRRALARLTVQKQQGQRCPVEYNRQAGEEEPES